MDATPAEIRNYVWNFDPRGGYLLADAVARWGAEAIDHALRMGTVGIAGGQLVARV